MKDLTTSYSIVETFESCPRRFEFAHVYGYQLALSAQKTYAADVGTALHEAIQAWAAIRLMADRGIGREVEAEEAGLMALLRWWPWVGEILETPEKLAVRSLSRAIMIFYTVIESQWWDQWEVLVDGDGKPAIEIAWKITHASIEGFIDHDGHQRQFVTQGKIDFILRHRHTGEIRVVDIKTTTDAPRTMDAKFRFSGQATGYATVVAAVVGHDWREHGLKATYLCCPFGTADSLPEMTPVTHAYSPADIQGLIADNTLRFRRMREYGNLGRWPRRASGCISFGSTCAYYNICHRDDSEFIKNWLDFTEVIQPRERIYDAQWMLVDTAEEDVILGTSSGRNCQ